jgi:hypothetical protein
VDLDTLFAAANNPQASSQDAAAIGYFVFQWVVILGGAVVHLLVDRRRHGATPGRAVELFLLWVLVAGGAWAIWGGIGHISGMSDELAENIGYQQSMFQWEVGWGDIAVGVLGVGCAWKRLRGTWMTAAVVALTFAYGGDAIGHAMSWWGDDANTAPDNVWALPSDIVQPLLAIALLAGYRRHHPLQPEISEA